MAATARPPVKADEGQVSILLVDDRHDKILSLEAVLEQLGENIVKATSGKEALRCLLQQDFAVILLDVHMPEMDGFETAAMIRQRKSSEKTPIIFVTAVSETDNHITRGYSLGAVDYIQTPIEPEILRTKVAVFVDLFRKTEQIKRQAEDLREMQERDHRRVLADATDRLETETKRNRFFTLAVDMLAIAGFDFHFKQLNPTWHETLGYADEELKARPLVDFVHADDRPHTLAQLEQLKRGAASRAYFENRFLCCGESDFRWLGWTAVPFPQEGLFYLFARDITSVKKAEEERVQLILEQSARAAAENAERRAAFLADLSSVLAASLDFRTTLTRVANVAVPRIADWCLLDVLGDDGRLQRWEVVHPEGAAAHLVEVLRSSPPTMGSQSRQAAVLQSSEPVLVRDAAPDEELLRLADTSEQRDALRSLQPGSAIVVALAMRGRPLGTLTLLTAGSARRYALSDLGLAEEMARRASLAIENAWLYKESQEARRAAEAANRAKDEFLATLSHELRTPLSPILGWTLMLRSGSLDAAASTRALEVIERNVRAQTQLIEDLLDVSRIVTGKLRLDVQLIPDLGPAVEAGIESVRPSVEARGLHLDVQLEPVGPVRGDPDRLQQIVWNLLSNGVKFTPRGGRLTLQLTRAGTQAQIVVKDTGKGIGREFLPYVFDRFRQADSSSTRVHGGLGLGLAIVRHLVELHGGTVEAHSEGEDRGSTFVVNLPLQEGVEKGRTERPETATPVAANDVKLDGLQILVVDDEGDMRDFLSASLSGYGATVRAAGSAAEAIRAVDAAVPDVLVSDIGMPDEDGYSLIARLRARAPEAGGRMPAAALTAYAMGEDGERALAAGFQMHLAKPINPALLATAVATLAGRRSGNP